MMLRSTKTLNIKNVNANNSDGRNDNTNMNDGNDNDDGNVDSSIMDSETGKYKNEAKSNSSNGASNAHKEVVKEGGGFTLSSKCLVDQLPNTLSVSFKGTFLRIHACVTVLVRTYMTGRMNGVSV